MENWKVDVDGAVVVDQEDNLICIMPTVRFGDNGPEGDYDYTPNARLIAAAPDLLDALEYIVIAIGMGWDLEGFVRVSESAIAKATNSQ